MTHLFILSSLILMIFVGEIEGNLFAVGATGSNYNGWVPFDFSGSVNIDNFLKEYNTNAGLVSLGVSGPLNICSFNWIFGGTQIYPYSTRGFLMENNCSLPSGVIYSAGSISQWLPTLSQNRITPISRSNIGSLTFFIRNRPPSNCNISTCVNGDCNFQGTCVCRPGWYSVNCDSIITPPNYLSYFVTIAWNSVQSGELLQLTIYPQQNKFNCSFGLNSYPQSFGTFASISSFSLSSNSLQFSSNDNYNLLTSTVWITCVLTQNSILFGGNSFVGRTSTSVQLQQSGFQPMLISNSFLFQLTPTNRVRRDMIT